MKRFLLFLFFILPAYLYSQDKFVVDSLLLQYKQVEADTSKVRLLWELSTQSQKGNFLQALEYSDQALNLAMESENKTFISSSYLSKGSCLLFAGQYDKALECYFDGLRIAEEIEDLRLFSRIQNNIGVIYDYLKKYDLALEAYLKTLEVFNSMPQKMQLKERSKLCSYYNNIGSIYLTREDYATAETYFLKALDIATVYNDLRQQGIIYNNMGKVYRLRKDYPKSYEYLNKSLEVRLALTEKSEITKSYVFLMELLMEEEKYEEALEMAQKAYQLSTEVGSVEWTKWITKNMFTIYGQMGQCEDALWAFQQYKIMSDSLMNEQTITQIAQTQMQFEYEKVEEARMAKQQRTRLIYVIFISVFALSTIIIGLLYLIAKNRGEKSLLEKENLEMDLEIKNKELITNVMYLVKKSELMNDVSSRLMELKSRLKKENIEPVQKIIFDLHTGADQGVWKEFELRFQQVHKDFYKNLKDKFPNLTPGEVKLCAFLRLNMTSKEISAISHQSVKSIEVLRTRIRKKLNLTNTETNLISFLADF
jgi:tetratricopeptide (TPR) repeat protein